jgi:3'-5' exoribonuclease
MSYVGENMKKQFVKDLKTGEQVDSAFSVKYKKPPRKYRYGYLFEFRISDMTDEMTVKYWGDNNENEVRKLYDSFNTNSVVRIKGMVDEYKGVKEISMSKEKGDGIRVCGAEEYSIEDFVPSIDEDTTKMMGELIAIIKTIENEPLNSLLFAFFSDEAFVSEFKKAPASMHLHLNCLGGLLKHTLNVVWLCQKIFEIHPQLNRDLLLTGAILHDIGKIKEYKVTTNIDISREGMLRGHIIIGEEMIMERANNIPDFPQNLKLKVAHIILSHHGELEWGSPKKPQLPEAIAVHFADNCDAKVEQYIRIKEKALTEDPWVYSKRFKTSIYLE